MKKQLLLALAVLCFTVLIGVVPAQATYLDSSWYAQLTNVSVYQQGFLAGGGWSTTPKVSINEVSTGYATFSVLQSGQVPAGELAYWGSSTLDYNNKFNPLSFDYKTCWTKPNLILTLHTYYRDEEGNFTDKIAWSTSLTDVQSGHVTVNAYPNAYYFRLAAVPEPSSIISLGSMCVIGALAGLRRRVRSERN